MGLEKRILILQIPRGIFGGDLLLVGKQGEKVACFSNTIRTSPRELFQDPTFPDLQGYYFAAAAVASDMQGEGLYSEMNRKRVADVIGNGYEFTPLVFTRTQNPLVEAGISSALKEFKGKGRYMGFTLERRFVPGVYGEMLTGTKPPRSPEKHVQQAYDGLDVEKGDAFVLIFHLEHDMTCNPEGAAYYP